MSMKKMFCFALLLLPLAWLAGCAAYGQEEGVPAEAGFLLEPFYFPFGDASIQLGANMEDVIGLLGSPLDTFEVPSCAFEGTDIVFRFPGIQIHTVPLGEVHMVHTIALFDDTVSTAEGIMLGSALDDLLLAYGSEYVEEFGLYTFARGYSSISFLVRDGYVFAITYELDLEMFDGGNLHGH